MSWKGLLICSINDLYIRFKYEIKLLPGRKYKCCSNMVWNKFIILFTMLFLNSELQVSDDFECLSNVITRNDKLNGK